ncbi:TlpA disulfide reductase family protein [Pseudotenacibaculum sp. MALMAid0570]|uniref:TlpA family protein disulfide reductase n=1 Tax=Pseudotenacibaculum sp. MALMAid0570 TaxID=3143938 RepID=UPI0032DF459D
MKKISLFVCLLLLLSCSKNPAHFSEEALQETLLSKDGTTTTFQQVLKKYKGKKVLIDVWASWCGDCIKGLPNLKQLQNDNPEVQYLFLSIDKSKRNWKRAIDNYQIKGDHYLMPQEKKGALGKFLRLWWIPRYIVVNESGEISLFKATKITDKNILEAFKK